MDTNVGRYWYVVLGHYVGKRHTEEYKPYDSSCDKIEAKKKTQEYKIYIL
jgi:hypothetical protein